MFSGFDDGGWWLVVLGCPRGWRQLGLAENWLENTKQQLGEGAGVLERERREKMGFGLGCVFFTNQINLDEFLSSK